MIISFCGHASFCATDALKQQLLSVLDKEIGEKTVSFYLGGYGGFDEFAYTCCKKYQENHPNARLVFVTPYITEAYQRKNLPILQKQYDEILYPALEGKPLRFAISYRNKWMAENADLMIAYVLHDSGGAYQTYSHAKRKGKTVINLADHGT